MAIYLGDSGYIQIKRKGLNTAMAGNLAPDDVSVTRSRFSFNFEPGSITTGDRLIIRTVDKSDLELVAGHTGADGAWYAHVDEVGGIRLFGTFDGAVNDRDADALPLVRPTKDQEIEVHTRDLDYQCLAQVSAYELTTSRETVDISTLGEEFRTNYANGMISGQGQLSCFWEYQAHICDESTLGKEFADYLARLVIRTQQGANFDGRFFIKRPTVQDPDSGVWHEATCIITNVALSFEPSQFITANVQFVTTGPIRLKVGTVPGILLQENGSILLQETRDAIDLE
jgi:hypothetical protein